MAGTGDELGNLFRSMGKGEVAGVHSASRMRALSGLSSLLRAAEAARKFRRLSGNHPAVPEEPAPGGSAPSGSNVVQLIPAARA